MFAVVEGVDGSGKTTAVEALVRHAVQLGMEVVTPREPGGTQLGELIRAIVKSPDIRASKRALAFLFNAARAQLIEEVIRPAEERGAAVILDRFFLSTIVYQGHEFRGLCEVACANTQPDLVLVMDISAEKAAERIRARNGGRDRFDTDSRDEHERRRIEYVSLAFGMQNAQVIDAARTAADVAREIIAFFDQRLAEKSARRMLGPVPHLDVTRMNAVMQEQCARQ